MIGEPVRLIYENSNYTQPTVAIKMTATSGDSETFILHQRGSVYVGSMITRQAAVAKNNLALELIPNDQISASWTDAGGGPGAQATLATMLPYLISTSAHTYTFSGTETRVYFAWFVLCPRDDSFFLQFLRPVL